MDDQHCPKTASDVSPEPRPRRFDTVADMWLSDDPPWDPEVLENIDELAWRLSDLRAMGDRGQLRGWTRLR